MGRDRIQQGGPQERGTSEPSTDGTPSMRGMTEERLLTVAEVAEILGIQEASVRGYKARGQMPPPDQQYGRTPLWREATIRAWREGPR